MSERAEAHARMTTFVVDLSTKKIVSASGVILDAATADALSLAYRSLFIAGLPALNPWPPFLPSPETVKVQAAELNAAIAELGAA